MKVDRIPNERDLLRESGSLPTKEEEPPEEHVDVLKKADIPSGKNKRSSMKRIDFPFSTFCKSIRTIKSNINFQVGIMYKTSKIIKYYSPKRRW